MPLTDTSAMPFGKHASKRMQDVPPDYLLWLCDDIKKGRTDVWKHDDRMAVVAYVDANRACLEQEVAEQKGRQDGD